jgi:curved DNA-binding protein CbpA
VSASVDHYAALDVAPDASTDEIRAAWRLRVVAFHPDRFRDDDQRRRAQEISQRANAAWLILGDPVQRARYDRGRPDAGGGSPGPETPEPAPVRRRVPCPSCAARSGADDSGGIVVALQCPACGQRFSAMLGARCVDRPRLQRRWMGLRYEMVVRAANGELDVVNFRKLPQELALAEGELLSIVFHPTRGRPVYAIAHDEEMDLGWRVG